MKTLKLKSNIFLIILISLFSIQLIAQTTYYVAPSGNDANDGSEANPWATIQGAINNVSVINGDIIIVKDGEYTENVNVAKELIIKSENGYSSTTVHGADIFTPVMQITSNNATIDGFTAYGATNNISNFNKSASILLSNVGSCTIINNRCGYDENHNSMIGIELSDSGPNLVSNNICSYNLYNGISLGGPSNGNSNGNTVQNNICSYNNDNSTHGIGISISSGSDDNEFRGNIIENNHYYGVLAYNNTNNFGDLDDKGENSIKNNGLYDVYFSPNTSGTTLNAYYNNWGSNDATTIDSHIYDNEEGTGIGEVYYEPWLNKTFYVAKTGNDANDGSEANPWLTIQGAIYNTSVSNGDTIIVKDGTYNENVDVTKEITLKSENGYLTTTVTAVNSDDRVIEILSDNVTIDGFTAYGATSNGDNIASIHLSGRTNCKILNNRCGVDATKYSYRSIMLRNSDNCLISNNICDYSPWEGLLFYDGSDNNTAQNNTCMYNQWGISNTGQNNTLRGNICENNTVYGVYISSGSVNLGNDNVNDKGENTIRNNGVYDIANTTSNTINAYYNIWGTNDATTIDSHIYDNDENNIYGEVYYDPWLNNTFYVAKTGNDANDGSELGPWLTIQGAINNSSVNNGDTIIVKDGTYNENVDVTKELSIQSENGYSSTTVIAVITSEEYVFEVTADNVTINGFTAYGATSIWNSSGVGLRGVNNCNIINNRLGLDASHQNWLAINIRGNSSNNTISNNLLSNNKCYGINIREGSNNNFISNNQISNNGGGGYGGYGIQNCENSLSNVIRGNTIENNETFGIRIITSGINLGNSDINDKGNNTIKNNGSYDVSNITSNTINAYYNIWGSNDPTTIDSHIYDNEEGGGEVYFNPWIDDPLPVELTTFIASVVSNNVKLYWQTATEVNNYGFSVERQTEGLSIKNQDESQSWETITFVEGHGNSNSPKYYNYLDKSVNYGKYSYRLKQIDIDGQYEYSQTVEVNLGIPEKFELYQNYPNPFNPTTTIKYITPTVKTLHATSQQEYATSVQLKVYDILGNELTTLVNEEQPPGVYEVTFDASKYASGVYYYRIYFDNFIQVKKMILLR